MLILIWKGNKTQLTYRANKIHQVYGVVIHIHFNSMIVCLEFVVVRGIRYVIISSNFQWSRHKLYPKPLCQLSMSPILNTCISFFLFFSTTHTSCYNESNTTSWRVYQCTVSYMYNIRIQTWDWIYSVVDIWWSTGKLHWDTSMGYHIRDVFC